MIEMRMTGPEDLKLIAEWMEKDPDHKGGQWEFFTERRKGVSTYVIEDEKGPVIFVRQEHETDETTRLHTQFPPDSHKRVANALREAYPIVAADAKQRGYSKIRFESGSIALVRFMFRFGFRADMVADI
jgi:hypothetical protein